MDKKLILRLEQIESLMSRVPGLLNKEEKEAAMYMLGQLSNSIKVLVKDLSGKE